MKRHRRSLAPGALAILGCYALGRSGGWLVEQVVDHVKPADAMWYEIVIVLIGVAMIVGGIVAGVVTAMGGFDD